ncbi:YciI family protein [Schlesneria sp.]|uniref:YciI family protein n=1 Tax=Schlesneria sp. TaxID=2762018 RepID=UPI002EEC4035
MRVMVLGKASKDTEAGAMPSPQAWEAMEQFNEELIKAGIVLAGEGLMPSAKGVRIRYSGKDRHVMQGPFAETKEIVAGYSIWEVQSIDEAIDWAKRCPLEDGAEVEIRPIFSYSEEDVSEILTSPQ